MNNKMVLVLIGVLILAAGTYFLLGNKAADTTPPNDAASANTDQMPDSSSGMRAEENMVVVNEQKPSKTITGSIVSLAASGFLVIHEDSNGTPGTILGASALLQAGESTNIPVTLSRTTKDGEKLHAMLHFDVDGNGTFDAAIDSPVMSSMGGPLEGWFEINAEAQENIPISI
ncbi:MAG TPA: hypothetical protein VI483_00670 [Candidatus Paceibacterota bacterium]